MDARDPRLLEIWLQNRVPVVFRRSRPSPVLVRLPFNRNNQDWLRDVRHRIPNWNPTYKCWETPVSWFDSVIEQALRKHKRVYVIQLHKELQKCAPACWSAKGFHCECSCMGQNHGSGNPDGTWHEISEAFAFQWGAKRYACRLIEA